MSAEKTAAAASTGAPSRNGSGPFTPEQAAQLEAWKKLYPHPQMGLIEALRSVQDWKLQVGPEAEQYLARLFELPPKAVREVATFYPYFTQTPAGRNRVAVCHNLSCTLAGAEKTLHCFEKELGVKEAETTADGEFSLEAVECLGACEMAPAVSVNDELIGKVTQDQVPALLKGLRGKGPAKTMPAPTFVWAPSEGQADNRLLTRHFDNPRLPDIAEYKKTGGYAGLEKALKMKAADVQEEVKKSNLRGLGGAGFPVAMKWSTVPPKEKVNKPHYLVVNADESEPGCFKDRVLLERSPHQVLEGALIAGHAIDADHVFIFIRGEYQQQYRLLEKAIAEARAAGYIGKSPTVQLMRGANAYISGADTALLETMEGKKAWPRQPPPFPTVAGVMGCPTVVNNVETVSMLPEILRNGGEAFAKLGAPKSGGTAVFSVSGRVARPGIYEFPMGTPLKDLIAAAGGVAGGKALKAVIPGGTSTPMLDASQVETKMDFDSVRAAGSFLGAGGVILLDESVDMVDVLHIIERFLWHESCGQCTPCREGSGWLTRILARVKAGGGVAGDLDNVSRVSENVMGKVICALGDTVGMVGKHTVAKFRADFEKRIPK